MRSITRRDRSYANSPHFNIPLKKGVSVVVVTDDEMEVVSEVRACRSVEGPTMHAAAFPHLL